MSSAPGDRKWFREPWPWLLASGPIIVVIASLVTAWLAIRSNDSLVSEDYYREGLAAQETIARSDRASALGLVARIRVTAESIRVHLAGSDPEYRAPSALKVTLSHPTRAGLDQSQWIQFGGSEYAGSFRLPASGHWLLLIEDDAKAWRMVGSVFLPASGEVVIGGEKPEAGGR